MTWSHSFSLKAKQKQYGGDSVATVAGYLCSRVPVPQGQALCVAVLTKDAYFWHDALSKITQSNRKCLSYRWWAAAIWNAGRSITAVDCNQGVDYCCPGTSGGGGGGGGRGSWRQERVARPGGSR